jgi:hypothetical protein
MHQPLPRQRNSEHRSVPQATWLQQASQRAYTSPDAENGTAVVSGTTATFTPGSCGHVRFSVKVTDGDGSSMTRDVFVFVDAGSACQ